MSVEQSSDAQWRKNARSRLTAEHLPGKRLATWILSARRGFLCEWCLFVPILPRRSELHSLLTIFYGQQQSAPNTLFLGPAITFKYGEIMELRHLRYFVAVAEELNFTHAAARLRVAQPALSSQIKDLEQEIEAKLFERRRNGVELTRAGKAFYGRARNIISQAAQAVSEARTAAGTITGSLSLGFLSGLHLNYLAPVIELYRKAHPKVSFDFFQGLNAQQMRAVREGRVDIAFVTLPTPLDEFAHQVIWRVPFKVVLPTRHRLAKKAKFELGDLRGEDFVFCTRESRPEFYDEFFRQCANAGFRPRIVKEVGGYPTNMLGLISVGLGISVLPHFHGVEQIEGIVWRTLTKPKLWIDFALAWRHPATSPVVEEFITIAKKQFPPPFEGGRAEL